MRPASRADSEFHSCPEEIYVLSPKGRVEALPAGASALDFAFRIHSEIGLHASGWGTNMDVFGNSDAKLDVVGEAKKMATFLTALGAK